ncbi:MAG: hypothetical protein D4R57_01720 [Verrucomicrobiales bacterium]|nr:MAG: hypothetical protein D4R57_01720 [Verrucomicrobiales bacterium]
MIDSGSGQAQNPKVNSDKKQFSRSRAVVRQQISTSPNVLHAFLFAALALGIAATTAIAQSTPSGKAVGPTTYYCPLHKRWSDLPQCPVPNCPNNTVSKSGGTGASPENQIILDAAGQVGTAIGDAIHKQLFGDPAEEARQRAAAQEQALAAQRAAAETERKKQADFARLRGELKLDNFDGDSGGGLLLKGVDVESGGGLALKLGDDDLQPQTTRAFINSGDAGSPAPNTDPSVVDLRDTTKTSVDPALFKNDLPPEQLPKNIDDALLAAYADAPPGVSDRVHQGFQAIAVHDWTAALAAFQDALDKNPGDASLKRLVDLAQFTLDYRIRLETPAVGNNYASTQTASPPEQNAPIKSTRDATVKTGDEAIYRLAPIPAAEAQMARSPAERAAVAVRAEAARERYNEKEKTGSSHDWLARCAASQMAAAARSDAVTKKYGGSYAHFDEMLREKSKAVRGEGFSKKELDAQFQKALLDYYIEMDGHKPADSVGGSPVVEEIALGGKG